MTPVVTEFIHPCPQQTPPPVQADKAQGPQYIPALDGVRAAAVIGVMLYHQFSPPAGAVWSGMPWLVSRLCRPGWLGVDLFFVLSGFLITRILLHQRNSAHYFRHFYIRRALRILPIYFLVLGVMWVAYPNGRPYVILCAGFLANFFQPFGVTAVNGVLWSLAIEEHFYLVWPVLVRTFDRRGLLGLLVAVCVATPVLRALAQLNGGDVYYYSWYRFDGLAWGACLAIITGTALPVRSRLWLPGVAAIGASGAAVATLARYGLLTRGTPFGAGLQFTCAEACFFGVLCLVLSKKVPGCELILTTRPMIRTGQVSYCMYLIHQMVLDGYDALFGSRALFDGSSLVFLRAAVCTSVTLGVALLSFRYFEARILTLKKSFS